MPRIIANSLLLGIGGFLGSIARYSCSLAFQSKLLVIPLGTLTANWTGCLFIGMLAELSAAGELLSPEARLALAVGW